MMPILLRRGICNFHIVHAGSKRIARSVMILRSALLSTAIFWFKQWPSVMSGFQNLSLGVHAKIVMAVMTTLYTTTIAIIA